MNAETETGKASRLLMNCVAWIQRRALWTVLAAAVVGAGLLHYAKANLGVDTDTKDMLSPKLEWRQAEAELDRQFTDAGGLVAVIDADSPELADDAQNRLLQGLRADKANFSKVTATGTQDYFRQNGLLFLDGDSLQQLADNLTQAQPFLGVLNQDPSLHGLFLLLTRAVSNPAAAGFDMSGPLGKIAEGVGAAADGKFYRLSWEGLLGGPQRPDAQRRFIQIDTIRDFSKLMPAEKPISAVRALVQQLQLDPAHGVTVRLTGDTAMAHEELVTTFTGMGLALGVALVMVMALLFLALRSVRLVLAATLTLIYGLLVTAAYAAAAVGHLNLISVAFCMLYLGLGLDYALYLCMQYRELLSQGVPHEQALPRAAGDVGGFMLVCAATTSLGFFAFVPTPFTGIAELGLISGPGMFISLVLSLSLLPALISLMPPSVQSAKSRAADGGWLGRVLSWPYSYSRQIWIASALLGFGALLLAPKARFDYDPINLRDPKSESVSTFRDLVNDPNIPTLTLSAVAPDAQAARELEQKLAALPTVARAYSLPDFVPRDQDDKLMTIEDLSFSLGPMLSSKGPVQIVANDGDLQSLQDLLAVLPAYVKAQTGAGAQNAQALLEQLTRFNDELKKAAPGQQAQLMDRLRQTLLAAIPAHLEQLKASLQAKHVTEADLPADMIGGWRSPEGRYRVEIWPKDKHDDAAVIEAFVRDVRSVYPGVVGSAVGWLESGHAVVGAFQQAFLYSFIAITVLLLVLLRSVKDTLLVLVPLTLAGLLTVAGGVLLDIPFNFANVIALPLILGVGVDYGVYLVQRGRAAQAGTNILQTSTARAVLFGALITMASFGNLALAKHPGTASMGLLLTVGLGMTLFCALILLPSLLARR